MEVLRNGRRGVWRIFFCFLLVVQVGVLGPPIHGQTAQEYARRAACIFKLTEFVDWPEEAFQTMDSPLIIGILGADPFGKILDDIVRNETVKNRKIVVRRYQRLEEINGCHILFISQSEAGRMEQILSNLKKRSILTIGETENFDGQGGMIRFVTERNKLQMKINLEAAKAANVTLSSKLLRVAELSGGRGGGR